MTADPEEALALMQESSPHLVLLDLMLPGADGLELMRDLRRLANVPVIFLSGYGTDEAISRAFESGADDYIVKPFSSTELVARVRAALRKQAAAPAPAEPYVLGDLTIDYDRRRVMLAGRAVTLTASEYDLLFELSVNAGQVVTHDQLLRRDLGGRRTPTCGCSAASSAGSASSWTTTRRALPTSFPGPASATGCRRRRGLDPRRRRRLPDAHPPGGGDAGSRPLPGQGVRRVRWRTAPSPGRGGCRRPARGRG